MMAGLMIFASCKKDKNPQYPFDHLQWITEEMDGCDLSDYGIDDCARLPEGRLLMDVGATKEDKGYLAWVVTSSDEHYSSGDIVLIDEDFYGYNPVTGSFSFPGFDDAMVSFISETKVKVDYEGTATVFDGGSIDLSGVSGYVYAIVNGGSSPSHTSYNADVDHYFRYKEGTTYKAAFDYDSSIDVTEHDIPACRLKVPTGKNLTVTAHYAYNPFSFTIK